MGAHAPRHATFTLQTEPDALLDGLCALLPARRDEPRPEFLLLLDTPDGRLTRAGTLLLRGAGEGPVDVRLQQDGEAELALRVPAPPAFARELPQGALRTRLLELAEVRRLLPLLEVEHRAHGLDVLDGEHKTVAHLRVRSARVRRTGGESEWETLPAALTLDALRGYDAAADAVLAVLNSRPGLQPAPDDEAARLRAAAARALPPLPPAPGTDVRHGLRADEALRRILRAHLAAMRWNEPGLRADLDTEFLHDWRVAVRRTRCVLGQIKDVFPDDETQRFRTQLGWLARATGPVRDLDVFLLLLEEVADEPAPIADLQPLAAHLRRRHREEHALLVSALDSPRARELLSAWEEFLARPPERKPAARHALEPLGELAAARVRKLYRRIVRDGETLGSDAPAAALHELRITAKKMRYVLDAARRLFEAGPADSLLVALRRLQSVLGEAHDAHVQAGMLAEASRQLSEGAEPATLLAAGRLAERLAAREAAARALFTERMREFAAPATRKDVARLWKPGKGGR